MVEPAIGSQDLILGTHGFFENFLLEINTFHRQLMLADHLSFEGIQPMQKSHGECRARAHATARWQVSIMMDLQSAIVIEISQHLAHSSSGIHRAYTHTAWAINVHFVIPLHYRQEHCR